MRSLQSANRRRMLNTSYAGGSQARTFCAWRRFGRGDDSGAPCQERHRSQSHHFSFDDRTSFRCAPRECRFRTRWHIDQQLAEQVEQALSNLYESIESDRLTAEDEFLQLFAKHLRTAGIKNKGEDVLGRWLVISKRVGRNPSGRVGPHGLSARAHQKYARFCIPHAQAPRFSDALHGSRQRNRETFRPKTHPATTHNELIKDGRFVLSAAVSMRSKSGDTNRASCAML
jgi:hypothetical protein